MSPDGSKLDFDVHLDTFSGPFDLLLSLIAKHEMDVTELALAQVTDEFVAYVNAEDHWNLSQISEFLVVAATLLELKAFRLLPTSSQDHQDFELLEARDLLFARLLQYKAFKEAARTINERLEQMSPLYPRQVQLEPQFTALLPELIWSIGPHELAGIAYDVLNRPHDEPKISIEHLHSASASLPEQAEILAARLTSQGPMSFRELTYDAGSTALIVARFLALLELFRRGVVGFDQVSPLGELTIRWTGASEIVPDDFHDYTQEVPA
jgi:segregation and condensation protein A